MNLEYNYTGVSRSVLSILDFTGDDVNDYWSLPIFSFYPEIDKIKYKTLSTAQRKEFLLDFFTRFDTENHELLDEKLIKYNEHWELYRAQITAALEDAFELDLTSIFNDLQCHMTFNPISPRYLDDNSFDVFYLNSERGALGVSIHEIIHFLWFHVWNGVYHDDSSEYETPHLKWILSEMVVEPIMRDERLASINPYFDCHGCVYPYFYTMKIDEKLILDTLYDMYSFMPIKDFMEESYKYCIEHEAQIRAYIEESENTE